MARYKHSLDEVLFLDMANKPLRRGDFVLFSYSGEMLLGIIKSKSSIKDFSGPLVSKLIGGYGTQDVSVLTKYIFKISSDEAVSLLTKTRLEDYHSVRASGLQYLESIERQRKAEEVRRKIEEAKRKIEEAG